MFFTVLSRLVSGSSPERSSIDVWLLFPKLDGSSDLLPTLNSDVMVPSMSVWDLYKKGATVAVFGWLYCC